MIYFKVHTLEMYILVGFDFVITIHTGITPKFFLLHLYINHPHPSCRYILAPDNQWSSQQLFYMAVYLQTAAKVVTYINT